VNRLMDFHEAVHQRLEVRQDLHLGESLFELVGFKHEA
jgi:hypothetical protein